MFRVKRRCRSSAAPSRDAGAGRTLKRIGRELGRRGRANAALVIVIIGVQASAQNAPPLVLRELLDAIPRRDAAAVYEMAVALVGLTIVFSLLSLWQRWLAAKVGYGLLYRLHNQLYGHLERLPLAFFTRTPAGDVQSALTETFGVLRAVFGRTTTATLHRVFSVLACAVVLHLLDPQLARIVYVVTPVVLVANALVARHTAKIAKQEREAASRLSTVAREGMSMDGVVARKTLGGSVLADRFRHEAALITEHAKRLNVLVRCRLLPVDIALVLVTTGVFSYVALQAIHREPTPSVGTLVVFAGALTSYINGLKDLADYQHELTGLMGRFATIFALLDTKVEIEPGTRRLRDDAPKELVFDQLWFRYGPERPWVLRDVTLRVPAGQCVAIVGASGAGKSTLGRLAVRLMDATKGQVRIDGVDIRELAFESVHRVGYVPQGRFVFDGTIRANICFGSPDATDEQIVEAARKAQIHDWIMGPANGYDTRVGTEGFQLSGGQEQRIVIARTLLRDPRLLVLDEATSALDNATQLAVDEALDNPERNRTTLLIAHRLSTVRRADWIVVLDRGRVVETGTHEQLLERNGKYAELVRAELP